MKPIFLPVNRILQICAGKVVRRAFAFRFGTWVGALEQEEAFGLVGGFEASCACLVL
jgi:hypothetical protein